METWVIVLIVAAVVLLGVLVLAGRRSKAKRERRGAARHERIAAEKHRARAEVSEELLRERAERDQLEAEVHELRARELDPDGGKR
jgi:uncharacterized membrane protein